MNQIVLDSKKLQELIPYKATHEQLVDLVDVVLTQGLGSMLNIMQDPHTENKDKVQALNATTKTGQYLLQRERKKEAENGLDFTGLEL